MNTKLYVLFALVLVCLALVACGGGEDSSATPTVTPTTAPTSWVTINQPLNEVSDLAACLKAADGNILESAKCGMAKK